MTRRLSKRLYTHSRAGAASFPAVASLAVVLALALAGCKGKPGTEAPVAPGASAAPAASVPVAQPKPAAAAAAAAFDPDTVPLSTATLPPFPYLAWPEKLHEAFQETEKKADFDRGYFVAGDALVAKEGRLEVRRYDLANAEMSPLEAMRNYQSAIKALGGVRIDTSQPASDAFATRNGGDSYDIRTNKLHVKDIEFDHESYLIRTADKHVWIGVSVSSNHVTVTALEEKAMAQSIGFMEAEAMKTALDGQGHVALYINFDTDKAVLREDGKRAVDEIGKLLRASPELKVAIEGHTDNNGDAAHNRALSEGRAQAVVAALTTSGIASARLRAAGFGAEKPVADNATEAGRARNRRVELVKL